MAPSTRSTTRPVVGAARARQGRSGRHVLWVLVFGVLLTVLGFTAAYLWKADDLGSANINNPRSNAAAVFNAPESGAINPQPYQKATPPETNHTAPDPGAAAK
jgi:hypothetical protein